MVNHSLKFSLPLSVSVSVSVSVSLPVFPSLNLGYTPYSFFLKDFIYLFLDGEEGQEKGRETSLCGCLSYTPYWGPGLQPGCVP